MQGVVEVKRAGNELDTRPGLERTARKNRRPIVSPASQPPKPKRLTDEQSYLAAEYWDWAMKIAQKRAARYSFCGRLAHLDWESAAAIGLCDAAYNFEPERYGSEVDLGKKFEAFALKRIIGAITDMMRGEGLRGYGRSVKFIGAPVVQSLATVIYESGNAGTLVTLAHLIADDTPPANQEAEPGENFDKAISCLSPVHREVFRLYYRHDRKMREIGEQLGLSESRVSQIHAQAIEQLRESSLPREALAS